MVEMEPWPRTPSTENDESVIIEAVPGPSNPQGQILGDSGVEGDNGSVEDSPNRRWHGELESLIRPLVTSI